MSTKLKKITIFIIMFISIFIRSNIIYAADETYNCDLVISADKQQVEKGESVTYTLSVANINAGEGIVAYQMDLEYDPSVFDYTYEVPTDSNWNSVDQLETTIYISTSDLNPTKNDETILKIRFTAKENATIGEQDIVFKNMKFSVDDDDFIKTIKKRDETINIEIVEKTPTPTPTPTPNPTPSPETNTYRCTTSIAQDKTQLKEGESVTFKIRASNINAGDGLIAFQTSMIYDEDIFTCKFEGNDEGTWIIEQQLNGLSVTTKTKEYQPSKTNAVVAKVILTVKEGATAGNQEITFKKMNYGFIDSSSNKNMVAGDATKTVEILETESNNTENDDPEDESEEENGEGTGDGMEEDNEDEDEDDKEDDEEELKQKSSKNTKKSSNNDYDDEDDEEFPKTGLRGNIIITLIIGISIVSVVLFIKYKNLDRI